MQDQANFPATGDSRAEGHAVLQALRAAASTGPPGVVKALEFWARTVGADGLLAGDGRHDEGAFAALGRVAYEAGVQRSALDELVGAARVAFSGEADTRVARLRGLAVGAWLGAASQASATDGSRASSSPGGSPGIQGPDASSTHAGTGKMIDEPGALEPELRQILRHDIKTPLQAASLNLELLALEQEGNADVIGAIETIQHSLDAAVEMLQRFDHL